MGLMSFVKGELIEIIDVKFQLGKGLERGGGGGAAGTAAELAVGLSIAQQMMQLPSPSCSAPLKQRHWRACRRPTCSPCWNPAS